jgi:hypothetical protein
MQAGRGQRQRHRYGRQGRPSPTSSEELARGAGRRNTQLSTSAATSMACRVPLPLPGSGQGERPAEDGGARLAAAAWVTSRRKAATSDTRPRSADVSGRTISRRTSCRETNRGEGVAAVHGWG